MEYDAVADCAGADAWTCLARTVEQTSYHRNGAGLRRAGWDGEDGEDGGDDGLVQEDGEEEALELKLMRCELCSFRLCVKPLSLPPPIPLHLFFACYKHKTACFLSAFVGSR